MAALLVAVPLAAQVTPPRPVQRPPTRDSAATSRATRPGQPRDTSRRDTSGTQWHPADDVMQALLARQGYTVTRYQGDVAAFDATTNAFSISASAGQRAQVEREGQRVDTDSLIVYRDQHVDVSGRFRMTAGGGQPPVAGVGSATYDMSARSGRLTNAHVIMDPWYITSDIGKTALGDSVRRIPTRFYGLGGTLTSCDDSLPDYHFALKEIKRTDRTLVARPAVMYIRDIPVMWLPFVWQDVRRGRRSGIMAPRFGVSDIVRNNPNYRRHIENLGYYWAMNDYMDLATWVDWRSAAGGDSLDPGWYKVGLDWKYSWKSQFLDGNIASSYQRTGNQSDNLAVSWGHKQRFGDRSITSSINYVTSTQLQRQNTFNPYQAMSLIKSQFSFSDKLGPASLQVGGTRTQYPGRDQVDQQVPNISLTSAPLALFSWLTWTPGFTYSETSTLHIDTPWQFSQRFVSDSTGQLVRADSIDRSQTTRTINLNTPIRIFGYEFRSGVRINDWEKNYPQEQVVFIGADTSRRETRVFPRTFGTEVDWNPQIALPSLFNNRFKLAPTISYSNVDSRPFWVRSYLSGGKFAHQTKRVSYSIGMAPTIYGLFPGVGPFSALRHSVSPTLSYSIAPKATVSDEYLTAVGETRQGYLGGLPMSAISFGLSQNIEAKVPAPASRDSLSGVAGAGQKLKILSMQFSSISYDFERARKVGRSLAGLTTENFGTRVSSDLLPGMDFSLDYSLFRGSTMTDTAEFDPFLTRLASTVRFSKRENPFTVIARLFAPAAAPSIARDTTATGLSEFGRQGTLPVAGTGARSAFNVPQVDGWQANFNFSLARSRKPRPGDQVIQYDPAARCEPLRLINQFEFENCKARPTEGPPPTDIYGGTPQVLGPPQMNVSGDVRFPLTKKWAATWNSSYDFVRHQFASQQVTLQRDMHDWRSVFMITRAPNGNFAFSFNIALKPEPDLKFDYSRASVRSGR